MFSLVSFDSTVIISTILAGVYYSFLLSDYIYAWDLYYLPCLFPRLLKDLFVWIGLLSIVLDSKSSDLLSYSVLPSALSGDKSDSEGF